MTVRASMAALITQVRLLVNDSGTPLFSDQQVQDSLDHHRVDINYLELATKQTIQQGGQVAWLDYYALSGSMKVTDWETDAVLQGYPAFTILTAATNDYLTGHWTFDTSINSYGQRPPVYIIGKTYDRFGAAVELLEDWAAQVLLKFDFATDRQSFKVSQQAVALQTLADRYKRKMRATTLQMYRGDTPPALWQRGYNDATGTRF